MKLYAIILYSTANPEKPRALQAVFDVSSFGWLERGSVRDFMMFFSSMIVSRLKPGDRKSIEDKDQPYLCNVAIQHDNLACATITDKDYDDRVMFNMIKIVLEKFKSEYPYPDLRNSLNYNKLEFLALENYLKEYQDPTKVDKILATREELRRTEHLVKENIDLLIQRGERLDDLAEKSEYLSETSKTFLKASKKAKCCRYA